MSILFSPLTVGTMRLENRVVFPAIVSRLASADGHVTTELSRRITRIGQGGAGLVILEATAVTPTRSGALLRLHGEEFVCGMSGLTERFHQSAPGKIGVQLVHFLKVSRSGWRQLIEDLHSNEIRRIAAEFGRAAYRARIAGFDCVELHCAHAYTLASFLSLRNRRTDEFGGDLDGRMRLVEDVLDRVRAEAGADFPVGCRINGDEFIIGGNTLLQSGQIAARLASRAVAYVSVSAGGKFEDCQTVGGVLWPYSGYSGSRTMPDATMPDGVNVYLADGIKKAALSYGTPVAAAGKIPGPELAESILASGSADLIAIGRGLLCDPDWPQKAESGRAGDIVRCRYCGGCLQDDREFHPVTCRLWG